MNRRDILLALSKSGELTPDRSLAIRSLPDEKLRSQITIWGITDPDALLIAGVQRIKMPGTTLMPKFEVERQVTLHLMAIDWEDMPVGWVNQQEADSAFLVEEWERLIIGSPPIWAIPALPFRVSKLLGMAGHEAWQPLIQLIDHGRLPYGPCTDGRFLVVDNDQSV